MEVGVSLRNGQRAIQNIERLHRMADVDDLRLGSDPQDDPLHGADEMIVESEISGESDDRRACQSVASLNLVITNSRSIERRTMARQGSTQHSAVSQFGLWVGHGF